METNRCCKEEMGAAIEKQISKISSNSYFVAAAASIGASFVLGCMRKKNAALFVGQWVAPFLLMGLYSKIRHHQTCEHVQENAETK